MFHVKHILSPVKKQIFMYFYIYSFNSFNAVYMSRYYYASTIWATFYYLSTLPIVIRGSRVVVKEYQYLRKIHALFPVLRMVS